MENYRHQHHSLKFNLSLHVIFEKAIDPEIKTDPPVILNTEPLAIYSSDNIAKELKKAEKQIVNFIDAYERNGSGWVLSDILKLDLHLYRLNPLRGSSYHQLPKWIRDKKAVVNVRNNGNDCFKWTVLAGLDEPTTRQDTKNVCLQYISRTIQF